MKSKTDLLEFSVTSFEISLNQSQRGDKRGRGGMNYNQFIHDMKMLDQEILDLSPPSSRFEKNTIKNTHPASKLYFRSYKGNPPFFTSSLSHAISFLINP